MMIEVSPASRFVATAATATFPTQIGRTIYTKVERLKADGALGDDPTWRSSLGARVRLFRWCFYLPLFFWRKLK